MIDSVNVPFTHDTIPVVHPENKLKHNILLENTWIKLVLLIDENGAVQSTFTSGMVCKLLERNIRFHKMEKLPTWL